MKLSLLFLISALAVAADSPDPITTKHEKLLYPIVRVQVGRVGGSGTVIYSEDRGGKGKHETFVLTNHHVVADAIKLVKRWNNARQEFVVEEENDLVDVELFSWHGGTIVDKRVIKAAVFAHSAEDDIALLELRSNEDSYPLQLPHVARLISVDAASRLRVFQAIYKVGCSLGHDPIHSSGDITDLSDLIEGKTYMMGSAPVIFGDSGSAIFVDLDGEYQLIGIPARVARAGFTGVAAHMNWFVPPSRIWSFFRSQGLEFLRDGTKTPEDARKTKQARREKVSGAEGGKNPGAGQN